MDLRNAIDPQNYPSSGSKLFSLPNKYIAILIVLLCLVSLGSAIYFFVLNNKKGSIGDNVSQVNIIPSPTLTPESDNPPKPIEDLNKITNGWLVYNNTKSAFSIKYPLDWTAKNTAQPDPKILEYVVFNPLTATKAGELSITLTYTTRSYKEVLDSDPQPGETIIVSSISGTRKLKKDSQRNISISVSLHHNSNTLILLGREKHKDIFNQMLSTLNLAH